MVHLCQDTFRLDHNNELLDFTMSAGADPEKIIVGGETLNFRQANFFRKTLLYIRLMYLSHEHTLRYENHPGANNVTWALLGVGPL